MKWWWKIVNIGSMGKTSCQSNTFFRFYAKAGLHFYTAMELADYNIRVNAVSPAVVNTHCTVAFLAEKHAEDLMVIQ
jgi:NAD(P)-dependent dehydrogenase (short-subunit alcohol dehydrogenase family)